MAKKMTNDDPVIRRISKKLTLKLPAKSNDIYFDLIESIISQQLSGSAAKTIFNRFLDLFRDRYPDSKKLIKMDDQKLRGAGLSNAKSKYVKAVAEFSMNNRLDIEFIEKMTDDEIIAYLTQIKGIGKWTVEMILIFSLQRPDVFPYDDLIIKRSIIELYKLKSEGKELINRMNEIADKWKPNRTSATMLLWAYNDQLKKQSTKN